MTLKKLPLWTALRERLRRQTSHAGAKSALARELGVTRQAVWKWREAYRRSGSAGLNRRLRPGRPAKLSAAQRRALPALLALGAESYGFSTPIWTTQRVADLLRNRFGVRYHADHVGRLLHACGLSWQKATGRALERDEAAITRWKSRIWPRLKKKRMRKGP